MGAGKRRFAELTAVLALISGAGLTMRSVRGGLGISGLLLGLCALPALRMAAAAPRLRRRAQPFGIGLVVAGLALAVAGVLITRHDHGLDLLRYDFTARQVAGYAAVQLAGLGWVAGGVLLVVAGAATITSSIPLRRLAVAGTLLLDAGFALALAAYAYTSLRYRGGTLQSPFILAGVLVALSAVLLLIVLREPRRVRPAPSRLRRSPETPVLGLTLRRTGGRTRRWMIRLAVASVAIVAGGAAFAGFREANPGLALADLFPDPGLATCVAQRISDDPSATGTGTVSRRELISVFSLTCTASPAATPYGLAPQAIQRLDGLGNLPNLSRLDISGQRVVDLAPLASTPNLTKLRATNNRIQDLGPLQGLTGLTSLGLSGNQISSVAPLAGLSALTDLGLSGNQISSVEPLSGLVSLTDLDVGHNRIRTVSALSGLSQLDTINVAANRISDLTPVCTPPGVTDLNVAKNQITDVAPLARCAKVKQLWLGQNPLTDVTPLAQMPSLAGVDLSDVDTFTLRGIDVLTKKGIYIGGGAMPHEE